MRNKILACGAALVLAASALVAVSPAQAQWRGHRHYGGYYGGYYGGGGAIAGFAAGALLGGALAAQPRYYYGPGYYQPGYVGGDAVGYCLSRFKSYDPRSGTYLGYDGYRHPCP